VTCAILFHLPCILDVGLPSVYCHYCHTYDVSCPLIPILDTSGERRALGSRAMSAFFCHAMCLQRYGHCVPVHYTPYACRLLLKLSHTMFLLSPSSRVAGLTCMPVAYVAFASSTCCWVGEGCGRSGGVCYVPVVWEAVAWLAACFEHQSVSSFWRACGMEQTAAATVQRWQQQALWARTGFTGTAAYRSEPQCCDA